MTNSDEVFPESERTPLESPYSLKAVMGKLDQIGGTVAHIADDQSASRIMIEGVARDIRNLSSRVTALELSSRWLPLLFSSLALAVSLWSALRLR